MISIQKATIGKQPVMHIGTSVERLTITVDNNGSEFFETDTKNRYIWDGNGWKPKEMHYLDLGQVITGGALAAGATAYSNWVDGVDWVRNIVTLSQSDQQFDLGYLNRDSNLIDDSGQTNWFVTASIATGALWRKGSYVGNMSVSGYGIRFIIKNSSASPATFANLRVQLMGL